MTAGPHDLFCIEISPSQKRAVYPILLLQAQVKNTTRVGVTKTLIPIQSKNLWKNEYLRNLLYRRSFYRMTSCFVFQKIMAGLDLTYKMSFTGRLQTYLSLASGIRNPTCVKCASAGPASFSGPKVS